MPQSSFILITNQDHAYYEAAREIYNASFADDERVPFDALVRWLAADDWQSALGVLVDVGKVVAMGSVVFFADYRMGYLPYLAVRDGLRGRGYGQTLVASLLDWVRERSQKTTGQAPRLTFWDVRDPEETNREAEKVIRQRRIEFYRRLGGEVLPIAYTYPPVAEGQPAVKSLLTACTYPPGKAISRQDALDVAWLVCVVASHEEPQNKYHKAALASIDLNWPE